MKKYICLFLSFFIVFILTSCGNAAYDKSQEAYNEISKAYEISDQMGSDIYEAWRLGIYEDEAILDDGASYLAKELGLSEDEIVEGIVYTYMEMVSDIDYETATEEEKEEGRNFADAYFALMEDDLFSACVMAVSNAYKANGKVAEAQTALDNAKALMKDLSSKHADYEHYPNLKGYFTNTSSLFEFCKNPDGSFEQVKDTINDYRNEARDFKSDLDYIFE